MPAKNAIISSMTASTDTIHGYHAHVYFNADTLAPGPRALRSRGREISVEDGPGA